MPADAVTIEKKKTRTNYDSPIMEARVIANYGDPGIDEDYHFDILSRYVIVMIESSQRVPTTDKWPSMLAVVKRPSSLWINCVGTPSNPTNQQRTDSAGNTNVGLAGGFSVNGISRIAPAYAMGEIIKIRKINYPIQPSTDTTGTLQSAFARWDSTVWSYGGWHSDGSTLPYFSDTNMQAALRQKTIQPISAGSNTYNFSLQKYQYEAFLLSLFLGNTQMSNSIVTIFNKTWNGTQAVYSANGGYLFANPAYILINAIGYEDLNVNGKARVADNSCVPLVVTTPDSFPLPSQRAIGTIQYNPTYSPIAR